MTQDTVEEVKKQVFTAERKAAGKSQTKVTIRCNGVEIGSRTSGHLYKFVLVVTGNQEYSLNRARTESLPYYRKEVEHYEALATGKTDSKHYTNYIHEDGFASYQKELQTGGFTRRAEQSKQQLVELENKIKLLESGPLPEFSQLCVCSWHHTRRSVPNAKPWQKFVAIVELPDDPTHPGSPNYQKP